MFEPRARLGTQALLELKEPEANDAAETTTVATEASVDMLVGAMRNLSLNDVINETDGFGTSVQNNENIGGFLRLPLNQEIVNCEQNESPDQGRVYEAKEILEHSSNNYGHRYYHTVWASDNSINWEPEESFCTSEVIINYYVKAAKLLLDENTKIRREIKRKLNALRR